MSIPQKIGHARIKETYTGLEIRIPIKNRILVAGFTSVWALAWTIGGFVVAKKFIDPTAEGIWGLLADIWLPVWIVAGAIGVFSMLRPLWVKEVIHIEPGKLLLKRTKLFQKPEVYDLQQIKNFRTQKELPDTTVNINGKTTFILDKGKHGTLCFEYNRKTVEFASGLREVEARSLLKLFLERDLLRKENLLPGVLY